MSPQTVIQHLYVRTVFVVLVVFIGCDLLSQEAYTENPGVEGNGNHIVGPDYEVDSDLTDKGNPQGKYFEFAMPLAESKIFRGDDATLDSRRKVRKDRKIFVYVPAAYQDGTKMEPRHRSW